MSRFAIARTVSGSTVSTARIHVNTIAASSHNDRSTSYCLIHGDLYSDHVVALGAPHQHVAIFHKKDVRLDSSPEWLGFLR
jgi:adenosylmethionine-8-amino-7-oxononanoate aminotransferase